VTASPLPEYRASSAALGVLHFISKDVRPTELVGRIQAALDAELAGEFDGEFSATLRHVTPMGILQFKCLAGALQGVDALCEIVSWKRGQLLEKRTGLPAEWSIHGSWQSLLMEAAHRLDERALAAH